MSAKRFLVKIRDTWQIIYQNTRLKKEDKLKKIEILKELNSTGLDILKAEESFTKDFHPRHGSVISITKEEAQRLDQKWDGVPVSLLTDAQGRYRFQSQGNPIIQHKYTADPAALVENDTLWLFTGHDYAGGQKGYKMKDWLVYSTTDLKNWTEHPVPLKIDDFTWATSGDAYAGHDD